MPTKNAPGDFAPERFVFLLIVIYAASVAGKRIEVAAVHGRATRVALIVRHVCFEGLRRRVTGTVRRFDRHLIDTPITEAAALRPRLDTGATKF